MYINLTINIHTANENNTKLFKMTRTNCVRYRKTTFFPCKILKWILVLLFSISQNKETHTHTHMFTQFKQTNQINHHTNKSNQSSHKTDESPRQNFITAKSSSPPVHHPLPQPLSTAHSVALHFQYRIIPLSTSFSPDPA